jgi:hypothetical protein
MASVQFVEARPPIATKVAHHTTQERLAIRLSRELQSQDLRFPKTFPFEPPTPTPVAAALPEEPFQRVSWLRRMMVHFLDAFVGR